MTSLNNQITAAALKYLGGEALGKRSAEAVWRKAMIQYLGGGAGLGRLSLEALANRTARQYLGDTTSRSSLDNLLLRWAYAVAGGGTPGRLSLEGVAMRALDKYLTALPPPAKTYADFQAHIATLATGGVQAWTGTGMPNTSGTFRSTAAAAGGTMLGSPWMGEYRRNNTDTNCARVIQHAMPSEAAFNALVAGGFEFCFTQVGVAAANLIALNRNGYLSGALAGPVSSAQMTSLIYWDGTKAQKMNPFAGTGPTGYNW